MDKSRFPGIFWIIKALTIIVLFTGCGGGGSGGSSTSYEASSMFSSSGGTLEVTDQNSPIKGAMVVIPQDAVISDGAIEISIGCKDTLPSPIDADIVAVSKVITLTKDSKYKFSQPVIVTIPYSDAQMEDGDIPAVFYWDEAYKKYVSVGVKDVDTTNKTITFTTIHFSDFVALATNLLTTSFTIDTGFKPNVDGFFIPNFGSSDSPGGCCLGMASYSIWYYNNKKASDGHGLFTKYIQGDPNNYDDDLIARELISQAMNTSIQFWPNIVLLLEQYVGGDDITGQLLIGTMKSTGSPQILSLVNHETHKGHSVTVYKYTGTAIAGEFYFYDNRLPGEEVTVKWDIVNGLSDFSRPDYFPNPDKYIWGFESFSSAFDASDFETFYLDAEEAWNTYTSQTIPVNQQSLYGSISGKLHVNSSDGPALSQATVACSGRSYTTASDGSFSLSNIPTGNQTIAFYKTGYQYYERVIQVNANQNTDVGDRWLVVNYTSPLTISGPDLAIHELTINKRNGDSKHSLHVEPGEEFYIEVTISNVGKSEATKAYDIKYLLSDDNQIDQSDLIIDDESDKTDIKAGKTHQNGRWVEAPSTQGIYYIGAQVDSPQDMNKLNDFSRGDDERAKITVEYPKLVGVTPQISAGAEHTVGLKSDGTVVAAGQNSDSQCNVSEWGNIIQVSAGGHHTVGLKTNGTVVATGDNGSGQCDVSGWTDIIQISAGMRHTVGLKSDGTVIAVGDNSNGECNVNSWRNITKIVAGYLCTVGIKSDGSVIKIGYAHPCLYCDPNSWTGIDQVAPNGSETIGLKTDSTVIYTGSECYEPCVHLSWTNIIQVTSAWWVAFGLKSNGTVVYTGGQSNEQWNFSGWSSITQISANSIYGKNFIVGLKSDGTVVAKGYNGSGQCAVSSWNLK